MVSWLLFLCLIVALLAFDLGVLNRKAHVIHPREALAWTGFWIALALAFNVFVYFFYEHRGWGIGSTLGYEQQGREAALEFFAAYILEKSLSLDNIFVIAMLFAYFNIPAIYQHRVLFWGILGALVMRGVMITLGAVLIEQLVWMNYVFGVVLIVTAVKMLIQRHDNVSPDGNLLVRMVRRFMPVTSEMEDGHFTRRIDGRLHATPLLLVLVMVESTDLLFAIDSIPAVFAVTHDPFIVYTSNVFAILGLRSLYFALAGLMDKFRYLKMSLVFVLAFVGTKMMLAHHYPIPIPLSLGIILGLLSVGVIASIVGAKTDTAALASPLADDAYEIAMKTGRLLWRITIIGFGSLLVLAGAAMLVLPGPGILAIMGGLFLLGTELPAARRILQKIQRLLPFGTRNDESKP